jgi:hypothetical protein
MATCSAAAALKWRPDADEGGLERLKALLEDPAVLVDRPEPQI